MAEKKVYVKFLNKDEIKKIFHDAPDVLRNVTRQSLNKGNTVLRKTAQKEVPVFWRIKKDRMRKFRATHRANKSRLEAKSSLFGDNIPLEELTPNAQVKGGKSFYTQGRKAWTNTGDGVDVQLHKKYRKPNLFKMDLGKRGLGIYKLMLEGEERKKAWTGIMPKGGGMEKYKRYTKTSVQKVAYPEIHRYTEQEEAAVRTMTAASVAGLTLSEKETKPMDNTWVAIQDVFEKTFVEETKKQLGRNASGVFK